jgi:predicted DNA-binding transcriptional regulator AlpA
MGRIKPQDLPLEFYDTLKLAEVLGISQSTLKKWRATGEGPPWVQLGRRVVYKRSHVERWYDSRAI